MAKLNVNSSTAIAEIRKLITEVDALKKSLGAVNSANTASFNSLEIGLKKLNSAAALTANKFKYLEAVIKKQNATIASLSSKTNTATSAINKNTTATTKNAAATKKNIAENKKAQAEIKGLTSGVRSLLSAFGIVSGIQIFANIIKNAFELIKTFDSLGFALEKITKNTFDAASSFRFMTELSIDFGVSLVPTTERWIKFLAAAKQSGITLRQTEGIFKSMTKAGSVLGLKTDELRGIYLALEQMLSKGKVTTEELRRQLGERLPGAMGIMAASMGVTISELDKMMKKGEVLSAEVLPNFAKAVEIAYGLESVKKVETLVAAQNRLTTSWQLFVKYVFSDSSKLVQTFGFLSKALDGVTRFLSVDAAIDSDIIKRKKRVEESIRELAKKSFDDTLAEGEKYKQVQLQIQEITANLVKAKIKKNNNNEIKELNSQLALKTKLLLDYEDAIFLNQQDYAFKKIKSAQDELDEITPIYEKLKEELEVEDFKIADLAGLGALNMVDEIVERIIKNNKLSKDETGALVTKYKELTASVEVYKRLVETPMNTTPEEDDGSGSTKKLREIFDLQKKIKAKELQSQIEANEENIKAEETSFTLKKELLERNLELEKEINDLIVEDKIDAVKRKADAEILAAGEGTTRAIELEKEKTQKIILLEQDLSAKKIALTQKTQTEIENLSEGEMKRFEADFAEVKEGIEYRKRLEIKTLNETATSNEELKDGMAKINKKYWKEENDALIESIKKWIIHYEEIGLSTDKLDEMLKMLESDSFTPNFEDINIEELENKWNEILDLFNEVTQAMGDVSQAFSDRRIENIEAEIRAEENKYDRLLSLASDDAAQSESIQRERDASIAKLEAKRLKEEQKAAKTRKAFAVADIAIKLAQTLVANNLAAASISAATLGIGGAFYLAIQNPLAIALAAFQTAAVLAAPIPQYKDGIEDVKEAHIGMINDGGQQEYINRGGNILTTTTKNAIVGLQPGDTVYKSYDDMNKKLIMLSLVNNGNQLTDDSFSRLNAVIETSFENGFKKAKFNNNIKINSVGNNDNYRNSLNRWSK